MILAIFVQQFSKKECKISEIDSQDTLLSSRYVIILFCGSSFEKSIRKLTKINCVNFNKAFYVKIIEQKMPFIIHSSSYCSIFKLTSGAVLVQEAGKIDGCIAGG